MACYTMQIGTTRAIVCGPTRRKPKPCAFCGEPSDSLCDWPAGHLKLVDLSSVKVGDVISPPKRTVTAIRLEMGGIFVACEPGPSFKGPVNGRISAIVLGTCDKPCCYSHARHVDDDRDYCQDHWKQEDIA